MKAVGEVVIRVEIDTEDFDSRGDMEWALHKAVKAKVKGWDIVDDWEGDVHYTVRLPDGTVTSLD